MSTTVASIFDSHVDIRRNPLSEMINFKEVYALKFESSKYVCVLLDFKNQTPIDVLSSRRYDSLLPRFMKHFIKFQK